MKKTFISMALIVFMAVIISGNARFAENRCGGQEAASGIVGALGWKVSNELLTLGTVWLASRSAESSCPSIGGFLLSLGAWIL